MKSFAELDPKLPKIKKRYWQGKDLPFPVLLDATGETEKLYGIRAHPTRLLIDPSGKLVGEASAEDLEAKLPPLPPARKWARQRDLQLNVHWSFEPSAYTLVSFAKILKIWAKSDVNLDVEAVKASGLTPDGPLPGVLVGGPVTLRSIEELLLAPHGLGVAPSADRTKLTITKRPKLKEPESYLQKLHAKELTDRLGEKIAKPLQIKDQPLIEALKRINREFNLPIALDAKARHTEMKVSGAMDSGDLRKSLIAMFEPLGLTVEIRSEVVLVTAKRK